MISVDIKTSFTAPVLLPRELNCGPMRKARGFFPKHRTCPQGRLQFG